MVSTLASSMHFLPSQRDSSSPGSRSEVIQLMSHRQMDNNPLCVCVCVRRCVAKATHLAVQADDTGLRVRFILTAFHHNNNIKEVGSWKENTLKEKKKT